MAEVTKEDINRVHDRLDEVVAEQSKTRVIIERVETTLKLMPRAPTRPCPEQKKLRKDFDEHIKNRPCPEQKELRRDFDGHVKSHKEIRRLWQRPLVAAAIDLAKMVAVAGATYAILYSRGAAG